MDFTATASGKGFSNSGGACASLIRFTNLCTSVVSTSNDGRRARGVTPGMWLSHIRLSMSQSRFARLMKRRVVIPQTSTTSTAAPPGERKKPTIRDRSFVLDIKSSATKSVQGRGKRCCVEYSLACGASLCRPLLVTITGMHRSGEVCIKDTSIRRLLPPFECGRDLVVARSQFCHTFPNRTAWNEPTPVFAARGANRRR